MRIWTLSWLLAASASASHLSVEAKLLSQKKKVEAKLEAASIAWDFDKMWWLSSNKVVMEGIVRTLSVSKDIYHICMQMAGH